MQTEWIENERYMCIKTLNQEADDTPFGKPAIFYKGAVYIASKDGLYSDSIQMVVSNMSTEYSDLIQNFKFMEHFRPATESEILMQNHIYALNNFRR